MVSEESGDRRRETGELRINNNQFFELSKINYARSLLKPLRYKDDQEQIDK
ncbi:hypothetical protein N44_00998 [Microcystis aeruginosa NIES-44]|uniref:Uncharacterized protein n=1 Tax=Microcystis aeruginosa NIES-44 TaxID=449439 RepID=A0A0A1VRV3_MICAE|nr:hypothetical protein N44_00998 [Microcystis aeruginosa NIES-44]